jgi:hypothetical protein
MIPRRVQTMPGAERRENASGGYSSPSRGYRELTP